MDTTLCGLMLYEPDAVGLLDIESARQKVGLQLLEKSKSCVLANVLGSALGIWHTLRFTRGWREELTSPENNLSPVDEGFSMALMRISF